MWPKLLPGSFPRPGPGPAQTAQVRDQTAWQRATVSWHRSGNRCGRSCALHGPRKECGPDLAAWVRPGPGPNPGPPRPENRIVSSTTCNFTCCFIGLSPQAVLLPRANTVRPAPREAVAVSFSHCLLFTTRLGGIGPPFLICVNPCCRLGFPPAVETINTYIQYVCQMLLGIHRARRRLANAWIGLGQPPTPLKSIGGISLPTWAAKSEGRLRNIAKAPIRLLGKRLGDCGV